LKKNYRSFLNHFLNSELLRNTSVLISGSVLAQLVPIFLQPFLRRYFTPESFGAFSVYSSIVGILIVVSSFKYELAIVLPKRDKESINILALSLALNFLFSIVILTLILFFNVKLIRLLNLSEKYSFIIYLIPLGTFLINTFQSFNYWLIRKKAYFSISLNKFIRRCFEGITQVIFAFLKNAKGLLLGDIIGQFTNVVTVVAQSRKNGFSTKEISYSKIRYISRKYSEFPKFSLVPGFMSACSYLLPAILINKFYSSEITGYFDLSKLLLSIPFALVASSVSSVLLQRISERYQQNQSFLGEIRPILYLVTLICIVEILIISFFGISLFKFIFGSIYGFSGEISKILVWSYAFNFFVSSFSSVFISMRRIKTYSAWQVVYFIAILTLLFFKALPFIDFIKVYVFIEVVCYSVIAVIMLLIVLDYERKIKQNHAFLMDL
jgi:O-antigen/teichoic acid export membrane protein